MPHKIEEIGICDNCGEPFPENVPLYTRRGNPRLCCSKACTSALNSRRGAEKRSRKAKERVRRGEWENPSPLLQEDISDAEIEAYLDSVSEGVSQARKAEVEEGTWRNPALSEEAREKLSRPRVHGDNPVLHRVIERLRQGESVSDLSPEQQEAHRAYRRELYAERREEILAWRRVWYREQMNTEEGRQKFQEHWKRQRERLEDRGPNRALREARQRAGMSQLELAEKIGVSQTAISHWELYSVTPEDADVRQAVYELLGYRFSVE